MRATDPDVEGDVVIFLRRHVATLAELQILLYLRRRHPLSETVQVIAKDVEYGAELVADALARLAAWGLIDADRDQRWRYAADPPTDRTIGALDEAYRVNPSEIMRLMSYHALERIRRSAVRHFGHIPPGDDGRDED